MIELYPNKRKMFISLVLLFLCSVLFSCLAFYSYAHDEIIQHSMFIPIVNVFIFGVWVSAFWIFFVTAIITVFGFVLLLKKYFDKRPTALIMNHGIILTGIGFISWDSISFIGILSILGQEFIGIAVKDLAAYDLSFIKKSVLIMNNYFTNAQFGLSNLTISNVEALAIVNQYRALHK